MLIKSHANSRMFLRGKISRKWNFFLRCFVLGKIEFEDLSNILEFGEFQMQQKRIIKRKFFHLERVLDKLYKKILFYIYDLFLQSYKIISYSFLSNLFDCLKKLICAFVRCIFGWKLTKSRRRTTVIITSKNISDT